MGSTCRLMGSYMGSVLFWGPLRVPLKGAVLCSGPKKGYSPTYNYPWNLPSRAPVAFGMGHGVIYCVGRSRTIYVTGALGMIRMPKRSKYAKGLGFMFWGLGIVGFKVPTTKLWRVIETLLYIFRYLKR